MIKLKDKVKRINQYPGYTKNYFIDITRKLNIEEPLPTSELI